MATYFYPLYTNINSYSITKDLFADDLQLQMCYVDHFDEH